VAETVVLEIHDRVGRITLNRPAALNAISVQLARDLTSVCDEISSREDVWVAVLSAAGDRAFSVGADLKERQGLSTDEWRRHRKTLLRAFHTLGSMEIPVIAAVDGYALGGGCELALLCDFIIAGERAEFGLPEAKVGIIPGGGGTQLLPRRVGPAMAKELIFTGRRIDAAEALRIGLANRIVPSDELGAAVDGVVQEILSSSPVSVRQAKKAVDRGSSLDLWSGWAMEEEAYVACLHSEDRLEGIAAFGEKRPPRFQNR
jgi:enoyl-CoA hydratase/carnithine racemase